LDSITTQEAALVPQVDLLKEAEIALGSSKTELEEHLSNLSLDKYVYLNDMQNDKIHIRLLLTDSSNREKLWKTQQLIRFHTIRCIMQLQRVYVIKVRDDGIHTINGIPLPNSVFTGTSICTLFPLLAWTFPLNLVTYHIYGEYGLTRGLYRI
jgi:hypothetical protein